MGVVSVGVVLGFVDPDRGAVRINESRVSTVGFVPHSSRKASSGESFGSIRGVRREERQLRVPRGGGIFAWLNRVDRDRARPGNEVSEAGVGGDGGAKAEGFQKMF